MAHFEDLWTQAELLLADDTKISHWEDLVKSTSMKLTLLEHIKSLQQQDNLSEDDVNKLVSNTMGELLLTITQLSWAANVDVYAALQAAVDREKVYIFEKRYK